jgi:hypothetical protein
VMARKQSRRLTAISKAQGDFRPAHTTEQNTHIHIAIIHNANIHNTNIHNTNISNATMPANIVHRDLFEVEISHEKQPLKIYKNAEATHDAQGDSSQPTEHVGDFSGLDNKLLVLPVVSPKSNRPMHMNFSLMPGFDFRSGNAVCVELRVGSTIRSPELILKETHQIKQPESSSGFHWGRVQLTEAPQGTMEITVIRGVKAKNARFLALVGERDKPYKIEIEWRVLRARPGGVVGLEHGRPDAMHETTSKFKHTVTKLVTSTKQEVSAIPATAMTAAKCYPSDDDESKVPPTPSTNPETPEHRSDVTMHTGTLDMFSTASPTANTMAVKSSTSKRNAAEAFGPQQADGGKSVKLLNFQLRKAKAALGVAKAKCEQVASEVGQEDTRYLHMLHSKAKAAHRVAEIEFEIKAAELGDEKDSEYLELQTREAVAHLEVVKVEEMLTGKTDLRE